MYNLTPSQKQLLRWIVDEVRSERMPEDFRVFWGPMGATLHYKGLGKFRRFPGDPPQGAFDALVADHLLHVRELDGQAGGTRSCTVTGRAYEAIDSDFDAPDISFVRHLTPLADVTQLDSDLTRRCLPILGAGAADPALWDSAVRTAGVILEERIRNVGGITDPQVIGRNLVNKVFGKGGTLAHKFTHDGEREGHRELYAGVAGAFRNPSAHRIVDPTPQDGGVFIVFVNLLLKKLEGLR